MAWTGGLDIANAISEFRNYTGAPPSGSGRGRGHPLEIAPADAQESPANQLNALGAYEACEREAERLAIDLLAAAKSEKMLAPGRANRGNRLSPLLVEFFACALGHDFRHVRLHESEAADVFLAHRRAYAVAKGADLAFASGRFSPHTETGFALLAHELVHVAQQQAAPRTDASHSPVQLRFAGSHQHSFDPSAIHRLICPPGRVLKRVSSSGPIGTHYGWLLGALYKSIRDPDPYCLVDHFLYRRGSWIAGFLKTLEQIDPGVALAFVNTRQGLEESGRYKYRADILDAERDELYEIKPITQRDEGVVQLSRYLGELRRCATTTGPIHTVQRPRLWSGGNWDPSPYPLIVPSGSGRVCFIHARQDASVQGLLLYEILCCEKIDIDEVPDEIAIPRVLGLVRELRDVPAFTSQIQAILDAQLPFAPVGKSFAILVPWRVFQALVLAPRDREWQDKYDRIYRPNPSPAMAAFFLQTFVLAYLLAPEATTLATMIVGGPIPPETIATLWDIEIGRILVGLTMVPVMAVLPAGAPLAAGAAMAAPEAAALTTEMVAIDTSAAVLTAAQTAELELTIAAATGGATEAAAVGVLSGGAGLAAGESIAVGSTVPAWMTTGVGSSITANSLSVRVGLTMVGTIVTAFTSARVEAATVAVPAPETIVAGADPIHLVPTELLIPKRGEIALEAEVLYGGERYFIVGLVGA